MIYINRQDVIAPDIFTSEAIAIAQKEIDDFYKRPTESRSQVRYSKHIDPTIRDKFYPALRELFNSKCAYCETRVSVSMVNQSYDHFRPKNSARGLAKEFSIDYYWWLTYEWRNLYYSCEDCNQFKSSWFPVEGKRCKLSASYEDCLKTENTLLVDPCNDRPEEHLCYLINGEIDFLTAKGKTTIEILKLNRTDLVIARQEAYQNVEGLFQSCLELSLKEDRDYKTIRVLKDKIYVKLVGRSAEPFLGIQRQFLTKWLEAASLLDDIKSGRYLTIAEEDTPVMKPISFKKTVESIGLASEEKESIERSLKLDEEKHIYVEKIELKNFKGFSFLEIDFRKNRYIAESMETDGKPSVQPWMLFLGENGVGKSTVLKALVIGLVGKDYIQDLKLKGQNLLRHGEENGYIKVSTVGGKVPIEVHFNEHEITSTVDKPLTNLVAYNSIRLMPKKGKISPEKGPFYGAKAKNLFDYTESLVDADNWLLKRSPKMFDRAAIALKDLMLLDAEDRLEIHEGVIKINRGKHYDTIAELSDGYQSLYVLAVDIMATLSKENITYDLAEGMVLIDEIGTHLHPRWRMQIIERLRRAFPKIQFVVTTHEPLCLRGLMAGETIVLTKGADKDIIAITDLPDPSGMRIDQILTSELFGLNSTIDTKTELLFEEYYKLLAMDEDQRTENQKNRLLQLNELIPRIKHLGDSAREEIIYYVVDELLAKTTRKDGLKMVSAIKPAALERVRSLWDLIGEDSK